MATTAMIRRSQERLAEVTRAQVEGDIGPRYRLLERVGAGAFAHVWRVRDERRGEDLALKRVPTSDTCFYRESRSLFVLDHPHVVKVINLLDAPNGRYLLLEFCEGGTLEGVLEQGPLSPPLALDYALSVVRGLAAVHGAGLVHRDLKPANLLFAGAPIPATLKVADFGLVVAGKQAEAETLGEAAGTPTYMAPEQFLGACGRGVDLYALGVVLFQLLTGRFLFEGSAAELAQQHIHQPPVLPANWGSQLCALVGSLLAKDPAARGSAESVSQRIEGLRRALVHRAPSRRPSVDVRLASAGTFDVQSLGAHALSLSPDGLHLINRDHTLGLPGLQAGAKDLEAEKLWLLAQGKAWTWTPTEAEALEPGPKLPPGARALAPGLGRVAVVGEDRLFELAGEGASDIVWDRPLRGAARVLRISGGDLVAAGPGFVSIFEAESGAVRATYSLPGACVDLVRWGRGAALLLAGPQGLRLHSLDPQGALEPQPKSQVSSACCPILISAGPEGALFGLSSLGQVLRYATLGSRPAIALDRLILPAGAVAFRWGECGPLILAGADSALWWVQRQVETQVGGL